MKKLLLIFLGLALIIVAIIFFIKDKKSVSKETVTQTEDINNYEQLVSDDGKTLSLKFNINEESVNLSFEGLELLLHQTVTASGVRYEKDDYILEQWQGETTFAKGNKILFKHKAATL